MDPLTGKTAYNMVIRRLRKYLEDPAKAEQVITRGAIEKILPEVNTPRELFRKLRERMSALPSGVKKVTAVEIVKKMDRDSLNKIEEKLKERLPNTNKTLNSLMVEIRDAHEPGAAERIYRVLGNIYRRKMIPRTLTPDVLNDLEIYLTSVITFYIIVP